MKGRCEMLRLLKNVYILKDGEKIATNILFDENRIIKIEDNIQAEEVEIIDCKGNLAMPGLVDVHVHLREPGYEQKETILSGTEAAAAGGFTTIMAMPNLKPHPDSLEHVAMYQDIINRDTKINVIPYVCITKSERGEEIVDIDALVKAGYRWFSDDGVGVQNDSIMEEAMTLAKKNDAMIVAHTEDNEYRKPYSSINEGKVSERLGLVGIPNECEYKQLERDLKLVEKTKVSYHCCHMSAKESVKLIREYKKKGLDVSGEVTAHHLLLTEESVVDANHKMNPPLRTEEDRQALLEGIIDNTIEVIANDHAPHTEEEKARGIEKSPFGIVALETSFSLLYTNLVKKGIISLERLIELMSTAPAKRFGFDKKGKLEEGFSSDIVIVDLNEKFIIDKEKFLSKGKNTPFHGFECYGKIKKTFVNGSLKYEEA